MPLYQYHCRKCDSDFEDIKSIADRHTVPCPECNSGDVRIVPGEGIHKTILFPAGYWEHTSPDGDMITSRRQLRDICKKNGCYAKYDDGILGV